VDLGDSTKRVGQPISVFGIRWFIDTFDLMLPGMIVGVILEEMWQEE
jgi:hypothetical protein